MDNKGWIKLYRKAKESGMMKDHLAWTLFCWILLSVDRKTGKYTTGRFVLAEALDSNPNTVYKAILRLAKNWKVVTLRSNNRGTEFSLINWAKYQSDGDVSNSLGNNKVTTKEQQSNTIQEVEKTDTNVSVYKKKEMREAEGAKGAAPPLNPAFDKRTVVSVLEDIARTIPEEALADSSSFSQAVRQALDEHGYVYEKEYLVKTRGDRYQGYIDFLVTYPGRFGIELDRLTPRKKSIVKLQQLDCGGFIICRNRTVEIVDKLSTPAFKTTDDVEQLERFVHNGETLKEKNERKWWEAAAKQSGLSVEELKKMAGEI